MFDLPPKNPSFLGCLEMPQLPYYHEGLANKYPNGQMAEQNIEKF